MQTFLPYPSFEESARVLDYRRLGKQRVEAWQIYQTIIGQSKGWANHPAVRMWQNHPHVLLSYGIAMCDEWIRRGYKDTMKMRFFDEAVNFGVLIFNGKYKNELPKWLGNQAFHASHKSNLMRKDMEYYSQFGWEVPNNLEYVWPV